MAPQISIIGQIFGTSGYASHTRNLANALNKLTPVKISTPLQPGFELQVNDSELEMIKRKEDFEVNLIITHPIHWRVNCYAKRNWVYLISEGDCVPEWIAEECFNENIEKIIVASEHTKKALLKTMKQGDYRTWSEVMSKVRVIPHGVNLDIFRPLNLKKENDRFIFLANKGFRNLEDRGGIQYLVRAYLDEFTNEDNVELILKINPTYPIGDFSKLFPELKKPNAPRINLNTNNLTNNQLNKLYNECDVFVSTTRAEAFNLPCIEALACDKSVITTNFGGQTDFCDNTTGWLVDYDLVEVQHELEYEGVKWATPKHEDLKKALREAYEGKKTFGDLREIAERFSWDDTAKLIKQLI